MSSKEHKSRCPEDAINQTRQVLADTDLFLWLEVETASGHQVPEGEAEMWGWTQRGLREKTGAETSPEGPLGPRGNWPWVRPHVVWVE